MKIKKIKVLFSICLVLIFFFILFFTDSCRRKDYTRVINFKNNGAKNTKIQNFTMLLQEGSRPRFSPDGNYIIFDRKNSDGYFDLYIANLKGNIVNSLTVENLNVNQNNNGNGVFHPSGKYIIFISEEDNHFLDYNRSIGDSGVGLFCNLWAIEISTKKVWKLTDIPVKKSLNDGIPVMGSVNPHFTSDGKSIIWTERYDIGGNYNWGKWRIKSANFKMENDTPSISDEKVLFTPQKGNYVTFLGFINDSKLLLSGNLDGQHEYGMDEYVYDLNSKELTNLTDTPGIWEEDATVIDDDYIIYMSNIDSNYRLDFDEPDWQAQPVQREYYIMTLDGKNKERLTYFNDPAAPEYLENNVLVAASDISPDNKTLAFTLGIDFGNKIRDVELKIALIILQ